MLVRYPTQRLPSFSRSLSSIPRKPCLQASQATTSTSANDGENVKPSSEEKNAEVDPWAAVFDDMPSRPPAHSCLRSNQGRQVPQYFFSHNKGPSSKRGYATKASDSTSPPKPSPRSSNSSSLFSGTQSAWDHVFSDIQEMPPLIPARKDDMQTSLRQAKPLDPLPTPRSRRQAMTAREISAFDEMFNMIFNAVSEQKQPNSNALTNVGPGIGRAPNGSGDRMTDFFTKMRGHSRKMKWSTEANQELDRKKEEMELCDTDQQLLEWGMREVFGESKRYEEAARKAIDEVAKGGDLKAEMPDLQPATYPHLVALLMRSFRDKYRDPHLALSMFDHARHLSIPSYVFGCTTPAYNELIETRWRCFRDLKGVHDALEEMTVNGVFPDSRTRRLVEDLRRQVGERNTWEEENELGSGEVWTMLNKIDALMARHAKQSKRSTGSKKSAHAAEGWKKAAFDEEADDGYKFGEWTLASEQEDYRDRRGNPHPRR